MGVAPVKETRYELQGFDGNVSAAEAVELDMIFLRKAYRGLYLIVDSDHGILGRDVLTSVAVFLDGPNQVWSEYSATQP